MRVSAMIVIVQLDMVVDSASFNTTVGSDALSGVCVCKAA